MHHITSLTLLELAARYRDGSLDPVSVAEAYLQAIDQHPEGDKVYRVVMRERALSQAHAARRLFGRGLDLGPLQGVPIAIKDLLDTEGEVSASGSKVLARNPAATSDAPVAARLAAAGAVFLGRTTMTEMAYSGLGLNPHFGTPGSAQDARRVPGGSSSGSGVAVGAGLAVVAVGSDTGGSVRIPAAVNGVVGLKTTDGRLPTDGAVPLSTTLDTLGPIARTVDDAWALFLAMAAEPHRALAGAPRRLTLLAPTTLLLDDMDDEVAAGYEHALARLEASGHEVRREPLPLLAEAPKLYERYGSFAGHEVWANFEELFTEHGHEVDPRVLNRVLHDSRRPSSDYLRLAYGRADLIERFWPELAGVDAVVGPTIPQLPPRIDDITSDETYHAANRMMLRNTAPFNVLGCPAASVPVRAPGAELSVGLMIVTRPGEEELALALGGQLSGRATPSADGAQAMTR